MDIKDVENLADLARIHLDEVEKAELLKDMQGILAYVKQIEDVEVLDTDPVWSNTNAWREDEERVAPDFSHDLIVSQFPAGQGGFVKVRKIL